MASVKSTKSTKPVVGDDADSEASEDDDGHKPKVRWVIPHQIDKITFMGKEILIVAYDLYITFYNLDSNSEIVYVANNEAAGDGVEVVAAHKAYVFAFAEKTKHCRIMIITYPKFQIIAELKDMDVNRYKGLCMMENDLVAGYCGFPNYLMSVWSWRTQQRLISVPTGVVRRSQIYMSSRTHMLVCQCWGGGLSVWEVALCYKRCFMMKRTKKEVMGWEVSEPKLIGVCWSTEGQLYAIDKDANLYSVLSDGIGMVTSLEWSEEHSGTNVPRVCTFLSGILVYCPDNCLRWLKKADHKWTVVFSYVPHETVAKLLSNSLCDMAAMWTENGLLYRITAEAEDKLQITALSFKQRFIRKIQMVAPDFEYLVTMNGKGTLCIYEILSGKLVLMKFIEGEDISFECSPVEHIICIYGCFENNYGMSLFRLEAVEEKFKLTLVDRMCLTHQMVSRVVFSNTGTEIIAAAMAAGHIFILNLSSTYKLSVVRYAELGRGLADCMLMKVGEFMRALSLVLYSDKYCIGERIIVINAITGKDNKFAGKMQGPYSRLLPLAKKDHLLAIPHLSRHFHVCKLGGEKGVTVSVKIDTIIEVGHDIKQFDGFIIDTALLTFGYDGNVILRQPDAPEEYELKLVASHRYETGIKAAVADIGINCIATLADNLTVSLAVLRKDKVIVQRPLLDVALLEESGNFVYINENNAKNYLERQEDKKVREEAMDFKKQREEVVQGFKLAQKSLVELLEENIAEVPLHQLSLAEFNLHLEHKKERNKQAEREREEIRLTAEARIMAQDKVTLWIKAHCWDTMLSPRVKLFAIFSYYHVENYAVLPAPHQLPTWLDLEQTEALRTLEMENDRHLFQPWEEHTLDEVASLEQITLTGMSSLSMRDNRKSNASQLSTVLLEADAISEEEERAQPYVLSGSNVHNYVGVPLYTVPQALAFSFMQMGWQQQIVKLNTQNMRLWFNKQFDELMTQKKREVGLVMERNARLRFIIEELNKLSDLRGSFHHLIIQIFDPEWRQEEEPIKLIKVEPEECDIEPYVSPSQVVIPPPEPQPKDDFKERALMEMMDGVLEKLWHEEIKKPIPMPQCMLEKEPEHFNEEDLRLVFDYEAKVQFRNEERDKYRKMLHTEYAKLSQLLNEGIVKFNQRVKETWLMKLRVDSVIGQENLNLLRFRRTNLDRVEEAEKMEEHRAEIAVLTQEIETLTQELQLIMEQCDLVQSSYDALQVKDKYMERTFRNNFADLSSIIVDQCFKFYKKRPKWQQRATMIPVILFELGTAILTGTRSPMLHADCIDYFRAVDALDQISNMPPVMDEGLWATMVRLRRQKIENEIRMRGVAQEMAYVESAVNVWNKAIQKRSELLQLTQLDIVKLRDQVEQTSRNKTLQLVLPAGQVEIATSGHVEDFTDACLILREEIEKVNAVILKVGALKLRMMRKQMEFRRGILAKEWEHAQMKMKLRHMEAELYSYRRLKIPKELQLYLKNKTLGYTEEMEFVRLEKEMEASKMSVNNILTQQIHRVEELQLKINALEKESNDLENMISKLNVKVSEKRIVEDPLEPIRIRCAYKKRMETLVLRSQLIREVQANHTTIVLLQTELELCRLRTFPTLAAFNTFT